MSDRTFVKVMLWVMGAAVVTLFGAVMYVANNATAVSFVSFLLMMVSAWAMTIIWLIFLFLHVIVFPAEEVYEGLDNEGKKKVNVFLGKAFTVIFSLMKERKDRIGKVSRKVDKIFKVQ